MLDTRSQRIVRSLAVDTDIRTATVVPGLPRRIKAKTCRDAAASFAAASKVDPSDPKFLSNLRFAEMNVGNLVSAEDHLYQSLSLSPSRSVAWGDLASVAQRLPPCLT